VRDANRVPARTGKCQLVRIHRDPAWRCGFSQSGVLAIAVVA
jgi:hypothetical protein